MHIQPGLKVRRITAEEYDKAIQDLQDAKTQLEPDGRHCAVCTDSGHMAWECHHNPLVKALNYDADQLVWRCFLCGAVFTDEKLASEHFGSSQLPNEFPNCLPDIAGINEALQEALLHLENPDIRRATFVTEVVRETLEKLRKYEQDHMKPI